jgi:hypothetical protein
MLYFFMSFPSQSYNELSIVETPSPRSYGSETLVLDDNGEENEDEDRENFDEESILEEEVEEITFGNLIIRIQANDQLVIQDLLFENLSDNANLLQNEDEEISDDESSTSSLGFNTYQSFSTYEDDENNNDDENDENSFLNELRYYMQ